MQSIRNLIKTAVVVTSSLLVQAASLTPTQASAATEISAAQRNDVLKELAKQLEVRYAIPETAKKLAELVRARQKTNAYQKITTGSELARTLTDDLFAVAHDKHLHVDHFNFGPVPERPSGPPPPEMLAEMRKLNGMIPKLEILVGNVGYIRVNGVPPLESARSAVAAAFAFVRNTDALIIDNRGNFGGDPNTVALYVSYLSEGRSYVINTFHWRADNRVEDFKTTELGELTYGAHKPAFILTSSATFSGGEEIAYDLQALKRAIVVGEVTGGGAHPGGSVSLGHQFVVNMPEGLAVNPITGTSWEGVGVKPDVPVPAAAALSKAHALAINKLIAAASNPTARAELEGVAMKVQTLEEAASGIVSRLANADLLGSYAPKVIAGTTVTVLEKEGQLVLRIRGFPDRALIYLNGNRYRQESLPDGFIISFRMNEGKPELLMEQPMGSPVIRVKQPDTG